MRDRGDVSFDLLDEVTLVQNACDHRFAAFDVLEGRDHRPARQMEGAQHGRAEDEESRADVREVAEREQVIREVLHEIGAGQCDAGQSHQHAGGAASPESHGGRRLTAVRGHRPRGRARQFRLEPVIVRWRKRAHPLHELVERNGFLIRGVLRRSLTDDAVGSALPRFHLSLQSRSRGGRSLLYRIRWRSATGAPIDAGPGRARSFCKPGFVIFGSR